MSDESESGAVLYSLVSVLGPSVLLGLVVVDDLDKLFAVLGSLERNHVGHDSNCAVFGLGQDERDLVLAGELGLHKKVRAYGRI